MSEPVSSKTGRAKIVRRHRRVAWVALTIFVVLGLVLESLHGIKWPPFVGADQETRRTMWRLAHAHGTLLALVNLAFASQLGDARAETSAAQARFASLTLVFAQVTMPLGFFAGGVVTHGGDPGLGILAVPVGGLALVAGLVGVCRMQWPR